MTERADQFISALLIRASVIELEKGGDIRRWFVNRLRSGVGDVQVEAERAERNEGSRVAGATALTPDGRHCACARKKFRS